MLTSINTPTGHCISCPPSFFSPIPVSSPRFSNEKIRVPHSCQKFDINTTTVVFEPSALHIRPSHCDASGGSQSRVPRHFAIRAARKPPLLPLPPDPHTASYRNGHLTTPGLFSIWLMFMPDSPVPDFNDRFTRFSFCTTLSRQVPCAPLLV